MKILRSASWRDREEAPASSATPFTDYLSSLAPGGEPPDRRSLAAVLDSLRAVLAAEIRRRGLWDSPPAYLGVYGWERWQGAEGGARGGPLEELLADLYAFVFVARLRSLRAQLLVKPNVEGLVYLDVKHFLHERQKEHDPLGSQVFEVLRSAVRQAVEAGELHVLAGDEKVRNDTVLGFDPAASPAPNPPAAALRDLVARWNDDLLPDLVTLRGARQLEVVGRLRAHLPALSDRGVGAFRFKDLIDPLKADVRARWAALLADAPEVEPAAPGVDEGRRPAPRTVGPDTAVEERELFRKLVSCVLAAIEKLEVSDKTRHYLNTLWQFLRVQAAEEGERRPGSQLAGAVGARAAAGDDEAPSQRRLAEELRIPRDRLPGLYGTLGGLLERCRAALAGPLAAAAVGG